MKKKITDTSGGYPEALASLFSFNWLWIVNIILVKVSLGAKWWKDFVNIACQVSRG